MSNNIQHIQQIPVFEVSASMFEEVAEWCIENKIKCMYYEQPDDAHIIEPDEDDEDVFLDTLENINAGIVFYITSDEDASAFKLRWC